MITGVVNAHYEATVHLPVRDADGREQEVEAILDTGFNGSLTLPPAVIAALGLVVLANGTEDQCDIYAAMVLWDGISRSILVEAADTDPLVGMALLRGHDVRMQVVKGGADRYNRAGLELSCTRAVKLNVPTDVGVPEIIPPALSVSPPGKVPAARLQV